MSKLTNKTFADAIDKINKGTTERRELIQSALEFSAYCAYKDRNADPAIRLFAVVGRETNRQNMATWLADLAPIGFKEGVPFFHEKKWKMIEGGDLEFEQRINEATPWYMLKTAASEISDTVDVLELVRHLVKKVESQVKKGTKKNVKHADLLVELAAIANRAEYQS